MNVEFENIVVHLMGLGKADGFALQSFEMSAEVEVFAFDVLRAVLADVVTTWLQHFGIAWPVIGVKASHLTLCQFPVSAFGNSHRCDVR